MHLEEIELERGLARQAEAIGEKIEAGSEERPYRVNSAQRQGRSNLILWVSLGKGEQQKKECDARESNSQLDHCMFGSPGLHKR